MSGRGAIERYQMSRPRLLVSATLALAATAASAQITRTELVRAPLDGIVRGDGTILRVELVPGGATPPHRHPGQEYVYVLEGSIAIEPRGGAAVRLDAGQVRVNPAGEVHLVRNLSPDRPARVIVFALIPQGAPAVLPAD